MTLSWLPLALGASFLFGVSAIFYKLPAVRGHSRIASVFWMNLVAMMLAIICFHDDLYLDHRTFVLTLLGGMAFSLVTMLQMYALSHVDTNTLFPITTTISLVATVLVGLSVFNERLSLPQGVGIALAIIVVYFLSRRGGKWQFSPILYLLLFLIPLFSSSFKIIQKLAADGVNIHTFQIYSYLFATIFALFAYCAVAVTKSKADRRGFFAGAALWGSVNGILSFLGGALILVSLTRGPFAIITPIQSLYIVVTALIGYFFFNEKLGARQCFLILLSIFAIWLMRLG